MSDYLWQLEQNADQKENILEYRRVSFRMLDPDEVRRREYKRMRKVRMKTFLCKQIFKENVYLLLPKGVQHFNSPRFGYVYFADHILQRIK